MYKKKLIRIFRRIRASIRNLTFGWALVYVFMIALLCFTALPLIYLVSTAFKPLDELMLFPPQFFVRKPTLYSFTSLLTATSSFEVPFARYIFNSVFVTIISVTSTIFICTMGAFALVKHKVPGAKIIFSIIIVLLTFPAPVTAIHRYLTINALGMINTYYALIIPGLASAYFIFLAKQFVEQFPDELIESARMDGCSEWDIYWKMLMPNIKPLLSTIMVFSFTAMWNDAFSALMYTTSPDMKVLPLALAVIGGGNIARQGATSAAGLLTVLPTIVIFVIAQGQVMKSMAYSGIKS